MQNTKKILFGFMFVFSLFGIFFVGLLAHEGTHVIQSKSPQSICYDMQQKTFMSVSHEYDDKEEYKDFVTYTEKWAVIVTNIVAMGLTIALGVLINLFIITKMLKK